MPSHTVYCPLCDKAFTSQKTRADAMRLMQAHLEKEPDYDPDMHDE